jgi:hypothetical protein
MERMDQKRQAGRHDAFEAKLKREQETRAQEIAAMRKNVAASE